MLAATFRSTGACNSLIQINIAKTCSATCFNIPYRGIYRHRPCNMKQIEVKAKGIGLKRLNKCQIRCQFIGRRALSENLENKLKHSFALTPLFLN